MVSSRKQSQRASADAERERRWRAAEEASPLTRFQHQELLEFVADRVAAEGSTGSFEFTRAWLAGRGIDPGPVCEFLEGHRVSHDYELVLSGDPYTLFGPTRDRRRWMPLERDVLEALLVHVDEQLESRGCNHSLRFTRAFLVSHGLPVSTTGMALLAQGGGCDCEVVLNVDPETIYPRPK